MIEVERIAANAPPYRDGTNIQKTKVALVYNAGGIGDYIHWTCGIKYVIDSNPHIHGYVYAPTFFSDLAQLWLGNYSSRFKVVPYSDVEAIKKLTDCAVIMPDRRQFANACGFHLTDLGFIYFNQRNLVVKEYTVLPEIRGDEATIEKFNLPINYVAIPVEASHENRALPSSTINALTKHLLKINITPIILGKSYIAGDHVSKSPEGLNLDGCIDLREKTTLPEAACVMAKAKLVIGMDGGLIHLAFCSKVPVVAMFTTVHPSLRLPYSRSADIAVVTPSEELKCRFCNTGEPNKQNMSYVIGHNFKDCIYKDNLCTKIISADVLIPVIDQLLERKNNGTKT